MPWETGTVEDSKARFVLEAKRKRITPSRSCVGSTGSRARLGTSGSIDTRAKALQGLKIARIDRRAVRTRHPTG
jgi:hypothetical protein